MNHEDGQHRRLKDLRAQANQLESDLLQLKRDHLQYRREGDRDRMAEILLEIGEKQASINELEATINEERDHEEMRELEQIQTLNGDTPIVFFPVKLETRFFHYQPQQVENGRVYHGELKLRIIPDGIIADMHEPLLTEYEEHKAQAYWTAAWTAANGAKTIRQELFDAQGTFRALEIISTTKPSDLEAAHEGDAAFRIIVQALPNPVSIADAERESGIAYWAAAGQMALAQQEAWAALTGIFGARRSAWIVQQTTPTNLDDFPNLASPEAAPHFPEIRQYRSPNHRRMPGTRLLPEYWVIILFSNYKSYSIDDYNPTSLHNGLRRIVFSNPIPDHIALSPSLQSNYVRLPEGELVPDNLYQLPGSQIAVPKALEWQYNFAEAEEMGMAKTIKLNATDLRQGFDRILVFGLKRSMTAEESKEAIESLLQKHHFAKGWSFVPQGTPTNNAESVNSGYPESDPRARASFSRERGFRSIPVSGDGHFFTQALGINDQIVNKTMGAKGQEQLNALAMARALWPVTIGYFLDHMMEPGFDERTNAPPNFTDEHLQIAKDYFLKYVRGRGPIPAIRVGDVPYGVLPATAIKTRTQNYYPDYFLDTISPYPFDQIERRIRILRRILLDEEYLTTSESGLVDKYAPHIGLTDDELNDLTMVMTSNASSREYYVRKIFGRIVRDNILSSEEGASRGPDEGPREVHTVPEGRPTEPQENPTARPGGRLLFAAPPPSTRISEATFFDKADLFKCGLVVIKALPETEIEETVEPLSETKTLDESLNYWEADQNGRGRLVMRDAYIRNYIREIRTARRLDYIKGLINRMQQSPLLFLLLRHSALLEFVNSGLSILQQHGKLEAYQTREYELHRIERGTENDPTLWERLQQGVDGLTGPQTLEEYLFNALDQPDLVDHQLNQIRDFHSSLRHLEDLPTAELERLMTETLDCAAFRLDAWTTSLANKRLTEIRQDQPEGNYIGAYGWLEDVRPIATQENLTEDVQEILIREYETHRVFAYTQNQGGFIHAPSTNHASAAAVLRNAWMVRGQGNAKQPFAVNLSSVRVRRALKLVDQMRQGQPIGAGLGYLFERFLHDYEHAELDQFIVDFRDKFPIAAGKLRPINGSVDAVAANNVVDGFALWENLRKREAWQSEDFDQAREDLIRFVYPAFQRDPNGIGLLNALQDLENNVDSLTDLLMSESVFRLVASDYEAASSVLDAMSRGAAIPEPLVIKTPKRSYSFTQRLIALMQPNPNYWETGGNLRSNAEPLLNDWIGNMLPPAASIECSVFFQDEQVVSVLAQDLDIEPIDFLWMAIKASDRLEGGELYQRLLQAAALKHGADPAPAVTLIQLDPPASLFTEPGNISFADAIEICQTLYEVINRTRALMPQDLWYPEEGSRVKAESLLHLEEVEDRLNQLESRMEQLRIRLERQWSLFQQNPGNWDIAEVQDALRSLSHLGISTPYPFLLPVHTEDDIERLSNGVVRTLTKLRQITDKMNALPAPSQNGTPAGNQDQSRLSYLISKIETAFEGHFKAIPTFVPYQRTTLNNALRNNLDYGEDRSQALSKWFTRFARVRPNLDRWKQLMLYNRALGLHLNRQEQIIQLPVRDNAPWIGAAFGNPAADPTFEKIEEWPRLALHVMSARHQLGPFDPDTAIGGLLLDDWEEQIPFSVENSALALHYDSPSAEAPEALILAVPPEPLERWTHKQVIDILNQTLDNAKIRAFDGEHSRFIEYEGAGRETLTRYTRLQAFYDFDIPDVFLPMIALAENKGQDPNDDGADTVSTDFDDCLFKST